ncbi:MAG: hypothetical protein WCG67_09240, partial [Ferruginibacter sp.]
MTLAISVAWAQGRTIPAIKVPLPIKIDGDLNDKVWETLPSISNFITSFPNYGKVSLFKTEVKIAYDDNAVYVAAHLYDKPENIRRQFTSRDNIDRQDVDIFSVGFDTYKDR